MKFAVYIVYNICKRMEGGPEAVISTTLCTLGALKANAVMSNHRICRNTQRKWYIFSHSGPSRPEYRRDRYEICCIYSL